MTKPKTVHVRINDAATGTPTPVRVRFTDAAGNYHAPFGRLTHIPVVPAWGVGGNVLIGDEAWAYIDGACEIDLPPGDIRVQAVKGPEFKPVDQTIHFLPGRLSLRLPIERKLDLRAEGWFSGDADCRHLSPAATLLEAQAEDLAVVNLLAAKVAVHSEQAQAHWLSNILAFSGQQPAMHVAGHMVVVNTANESILGNLNLLNCHRVVYPLSFDDVGWTLSDWCGQCHRKGGLVVWPGGRSCDEDGPGALPNLILGEVDALGVSDMETLFDDESAWTHLLNCGFRVPLIAGSRKQSNGQVLGSPRTYANLGARGGLDYKEWIEAVRAGRTFVTSGPLLTLAVEGKHPGETVRLCDGGGVCRVRAEVRGPAPLERLEILSGGEVAAAAPAGDSLLEVDLPIHEGTWIAARCHGASGSRAAAHTSAVYVECGQAWQARSDSLQVVRDWLGTYHGFLSRLDAEGRFVSAGDREKLIKTYVAAEAALRHATSPTR